MGTDIDPYGEWLGITDERRPPTHYALLGLEDFEGDPPTISSALTKRLGLLEPHSSGSQAELARQMMEEVRWAAATLLDPQRKCDYDAALHELASSTSTASRYFYQQSGRRLGPVSSQDLHKMALRGVLRPNDLVQREGSSRWRKASNIKNLTFQLSVRSEPVPRPKAPTPRRGIRTLLVVGSFLLLASLLMIMVPQFGPRFVDLKKRPIAGAPDAVAPRPQVPVAPSPPAEDADLPAPPIEAVAEERSAKEAAPDPLATEATPDTVTSPVPAIPTPPAPAATPSEPPHPEPLVELVARLRPSIVRIEAEGGGVGTGYVVDPRGWIATNLHVVDGNANAEVLLADGRRLQVTGFIAADPAVDLAILRVDFGKQAISALSLSEMTPPVGSDLIVLGFPRGLDFTICNGHVEGLHRAAEIIAGGISFFPDARPDSLWISMTNDIMHGNSGGPIVDRSGQVVGTVTRFAPVFSPPSFALPIRFALLRYGSAVDEVRRLLNVHNLAVRPLSELPSLRKDAPQPRLPNQAAPQVTDRRLALLKQMHVERQRLFHERDQSRARMLAIETIVVSANGQLAQLLGQIAALEQSIGNLNNQVSSLQNQLLFSADRVARLQIEGGIEQRQAELRALGTRLGEAQAAADAAALELQGRQNQWAQERSIYEKLYLQAWQLRREWLTLMDAFGLLPVADHRAALPTLDEWVVLDGEAALPLTARAMAHLRLGNLPQALADTEQAVRLEPGDALTIAVRGWIRTKVGNPRGGMADIAQALKIDRQNPFAYYCRAMSKLSEKNYRAAEADLKRALRSAPEFVEAHLELSRLKATCPSERIRKAKLALEHAQRACELSNWQDWRCLDVLAAAHAENEDFPNAVEHANKAIALAADELRELCERHKDQFEQRQPLRL